MSQGFTDAMGKVGVIRMASGGNPPKFYFHAQPAHSDGRILTEVLGSAAGLSVTVKAQDAAVAAPFQQLFTATASQFQ
jgi:Beta2-adaptin appendage, C-terminal sub-domain